MHMTGSSGTGGWRCEAGRADWDAEGHAYWSSHCQRLHGRRVIWHTEEL